MKKIVLSLGLFVFAATATFAQGKKGASKPAAAPAAPTATAAPAPSSAVQDPAALKFVSEIHDFGTLKQNVPAEHTFTFTNTGKEPIILQRVQPSCGCTTPTYSKDPILPGKTGEIKASYNAAAAGAFNKSITVFSNVGTKVLTIKGSVEKAPETSVPENTSMIKTH
jgi:hypothetical protein